MAALNEGKPLSHSNLKKNHQTDQSDVPKVQLRFSSWNSDSFQESRSTCPRRDGGREWKSVEEDPLALPSGGSPVGGPVFRSQPLLHSGWNENFFLNVFFAFNWCHCLFFYFVKIDIYYSESFLQKETEPALTQNNLHPFTYCACSNTSFHRVFGFFFYHHVVHMVGLPLAEGG